MGGHQHAVVYEKGVQVWLPHPDVVWINAKILKVENGMIQCEDDNGTIVDVPLSDRPYVRNPAILEAVDDLTHLSYLHEPAVLNTLRTRYSTMNIYTYCGIVLVAINPFQSLDLYTDDLIREYHGKIMGDLEPHLFALAEEAYSNMSKLGQDQSIVVSGESGAGKTVSAKYTMRYFATVGGSMGDRQMERQVLASNPVMEAFGNAKTTRNNNSSRFGKYIAIQFDRNYAIAGATMMTYLLEKSRVVFQSPDERSYHIFYQLCAAIWESCPPELEDLKLTHCSAYHYINQGKCPSVERVNDASEFVETQRSMQMVGIGSDLQYGIFKILAAVLHLGNVGIFSRRTEDAVIKEGDEALANVTRLLEVDENQMQKWLLSRKMTVGREVVVRKSTKEQALSVRDAFAKYLYGAIFDWIVAKINGVLQSSGHRGRSIGVLDIYGFELFDTNSFEQFCINYANEKLQQQFNQHVFKLEQEEYIRQEIKWSFIDYYDNQPCIDLIEDKLGVLALLDEEARLPKGSDSSFLDKLKTNHSSKAHFSLPRFGTNLFVISHFASKVVYTVDGFLEKNKDAVSEQLIELLGTSTDPFISEIFGDGTKVEEESTQRAPLGTAKAKAATVGSAFKQSLQSLMDTITATTPHYCRCIKPNQSKEPFLFEEKNAIEQLRACGVLETIRISAAGYPSRTLYEDFRERYSMLLRSYELKATDTVETCRTILTKIIGDDDKYQFGTTKIFFRAGQVAQLEKLRSERMLESILIMQKTIRCHHAMLHYRHDLATSRLLQCLCRAFMARQRTQCVREHQNSIIVQRRMRQWLAQKAFRQTKQDLVAVQSLLRSKFAREAFSAMRQAQAATKLQATWRMHVARREFLWALRAIIIVQNLERQRQAKAQLRQLKMAERDVSALKEKNWGLESKVMQLQTKLDSANGELKKLRANAVSASAAREAEQALQALRQEKEQLANELAAAEQKTEAAHESWQQALGHVQQLEKAIEEEKRQAERLSERECELAKAVEDAQAETAQAKKLQMEAEARLEHIQRQAQKQEKKDKKAAAMTVLPGAEGLQHDTATVKPGDSPSMGRKETAETQRSGLADMTRRLEGLAAANETARREKEALAQRLQAAQEELNAMQRQRDTAVEEATSANRLLGNMSRYNEQDNGEAMAGVVQDALASEQARQSAITELASLQKKVQQMQQERDQALQRMQQIESEAAQARHAEGHGLPGDVLASTSIDVAGLEARLTQANAENAELSAQVAQLLRGGDTRYRGGMPSLEAHLQEENQALREELGSLYRMLRGAQGNGYNDVQSLSARRTASISSKPSDGAYHTIARQASIDSDRGANLVSAAAMVVDGGVEEQGMMGMFRFEEKDERALINQLILYAEPKKLAGELPGIIAYIIFMCIKYSDSINNAKQLQSLLTNSISTIKHVVMKHHTNLELLGFWLANSNVLLNSMHYSEEVVDDDCDYELENFDLTEYRQVLEDLATQMYFAIVRHVQDELSKIVVPAVLENDLLQGVMSGGGLKKPKQRGKSKSMHDVTTVLNELNRTLNDNCVDPELTQQMFVQLAYFISATCLNNLLLRKDLCNWSKGLQIQFNISHLEGWLRDNKLEVAKAQLVAIAQATKLLQMPKHTLEDIEPIMGTCTDLNYMQIQKILTMYTPDAVEERVPVSVIREIEKVGKHRDAIQQRGGKPSLMLDLTAIRAPHIVYTNPTQKLSQVQLPPVLNLDFLEKL